MSDAPEDFKDQIPPGQGDQADAPEAEATHFQEVIPPNEGPREVLSDEDKAEIDQLANTAIEEVAKLGAELLPLDLRQDYMQRMTNSGLLRQAVLATGMPHALHELMPASGPEGVGALPPRVQRIPPLVRVLGGVLLLGFVSAIQMKAVQSNGRKTASGVDSGGNSDSVPGSHNVQINQGGRNVWNGNGGGARG